MGSPLLPESEGWVRPGGCSGTHGAPFKRVGSLTPRAQPPHGASASGSLLSRGQVTAARCRLHPGPPDRTAVQMHSGWGLPGCPGAHTTPQCGRCGFRPSCPRMDLAPRDLVRV